MIDRITGKTLPQTTKRCRFCAEEIQLQALFCKHCGRKQAASKVPRVLGLIALAVVALIVIAIVTGSHSPIGQEVSKYGLGTGERGHLTSSRGGDKVCLGESHRDLLELSGAITSNNDALLAELARTGRIRMIPGGTRIEVTDSHLVFGKVKLLDGTGREGWVAFRDISPDTPR